MGGQYNHHGRHKRTKYDELPLDEIKLIAQQEIPQIPDEVKRVSPYTPTSEKEKRLAKAWENIAEKIRGGKECR